MSRAIHAVVGPGGKKIPRRLVRFRTLYAKIRNQPINFSIFYEINEQGAEHALSLNNYHKDVTADAEYKHWVLFEEV
jgi:hypothetical protein